jgi:hypothetical protein
LKVGAENRNKTIAAIVLSILAVVLVIRFIPTVAGSAPSAAAPEVKATPVTPAPKSATVRNKKSKPGQKKALIPTEASLDPMLRFDWLKSSEETNYSGSGRNIFRAEVEIPKPIVRPKAVAVAQPTGPPPPPPPPPINLKFFGFANKPGEPKKVFLSQGEDIFIAGEGEIVDRRYKVLRITPTSVEIEDVLNSNRQMIPLIQG